MWQTGHVLVGLGRLDTILIDYYENDIKNKYITKEKASLMINDFMRILHEFYWLKSNSLLGDTGQIIILGGKNEKNQYIANDLTYMFIEELKKIHFPDPKVLLRVSEDIPKQLLQESIDCIKTGIGSPLFANDDVIIPLLIKFGYDKKDAYNYATSACWEPLIPGRAAEQNNLNSFVFMNPFNKMLDNEDLNKISSIDELLKIYEKYIDKYVKNMVDNINLQQYEYEPYVSLFIENCDTECKDITEFYGKYNYWGLTTVSLGNVVNSIINIDKLVFKNHDYTFSEFNELRKNNFGNDESIISNLKQTDIRYGLDDKNVLDLSNKVMNYMSESVLKYKIHGGKIKIGYSAPSYISHSLDQFASFDGRKDKDPFIVHISSDINGLPYTSLFNFASKLDYSENRFNGNVIDFIVNPSFLDNNNDKFIDFLLLSIKNSFFEMQMNVISSKILIEAKKNPKLHPDLIVRVWGFSAYFNDLPENYKDVLIKRTLESENQYGK